MIEDFLKSDKEVEYEFTMPNVHLHQYINDFLLFQIPDCLRERRLTLSLVQATCTVLMCQYRAIQHWKMIGT